MSGAATPLRERNKQLARDLVLDAAERLLQSSASAEFSMRELAAEAGVGFATPFNHFGSKAAIMQALSSRLIERMVIRFRAEAPHGDAIDRVLAMGHISISLLLTQPEVSKAVVGSLGLADPTPSAVRRQSEAIWSLALDDFAGLDADIAPQTRAALPQHLAFMFRGCLSFWIAGELSDAQVMQAFEGGAATLLLAFADSQSRVRLLTRIGSLPKSGETRGADKLHDQPNASNVMENDDKRPNPRRPSRRDKKPSP